MDAVDDPLEGGAPADFDGELPLASEALAEAAVVAAADVVVPVEVLVGLTAAAEAAAAVTPAVA